MKNTVLIHAEGSKEIGMGHISRACLISGMLNSRFNMRTKILMKDNENVRFFINERNIDYIFLPEPNVAKDEITFTRDYITREEPALFILDCLDKDGDPDYMNNIRSFNIPFLAVTDDTNRRVIDADIIVNGNPNQIGQDYSNESGEYLIGPKYFIMDPAYGHLEVKKPDKNIRKVLLTLGGSDHNNLIFKALDCLDRIDKDLSVIVVTSKASGYTERLECHLNKLFLKSELFTDSKGLMDFWPKCDMAITAAGNTLFERIAARLPGATICQLQRQMEIADKFETLGVNVNLGFGPDISVDTLSKKISDFINNKATHLSQYEKSRDVTDGKGLMRLSDKLELLFKEYKYELWKIKR